MDNREEKINGVTIDSLAIMVANGFESVKKDLDFFKLDTTTHFNIIEMDLKSVKKELSELQNKVDDIHDTMINYDKRIETIEEKVLV